eukprot:CAMPEP_0198197576 /NCGR_PEP_ID=MMETSP1445-20131203/1143_1 /TAXON_ID=36898 /ORGANISM="Pyramimonas sp., Strain CCMP2087" /LENGTH=343 /DNA_ID=CAMNT_0043866889 /DNA_START=130 /DNA_END=1161 /DNA_ORIENTATION=+
MTQCRQQPLAFRAHQLARFSAAPSHMDLIKQLRETSGAGILDVKKSLAATNWDPELAYQDLRKRGLAAAGKKSDRVAAEGLVGISKSSDGVMFVEMNSETDFVARNEAFQELISNISKAAMEMPRPTGSELSIEELNSVETPAGRLSDVIADVALKVRENIRLRRALWLPANGGIAGTYVHKSIAEGQGSIACTVVLSCQDKASADLETSVQAEIEELASKIAMHTVAMKPAFLDRTLVDSSALDAELDVLRSQAEGSGKPPQIVEKIVTGRLNKYYEDVCLVDQKCVLDEEGKKSVKAYVEAAGKQLGVNLIVTGFLRVQCGEGIEKEAKDFAAEVKATAGM